MKLDAAKTLDRKGWHDLANTLKYETGNLLDGAFVAARSGNRFQSVNPANGTALAWVPRSAEADVDAAVASARKAFKSGVWSRSAPRHRMDVMFRFTELIAQ